MDSDGLALRPETTTIYLQFVLTIRAFSRRHRMKQSVLVDIRTRQEASVETFSEKSRVCVRPVELEKDLSLITFMVFTEIFNILISLLFFLFFPPGVNQNQ